MSKFAQLGLSSQLTKAVETSGYDKPTPIQEKVIPLMLKGEDIVGIAQTGTGKTAAFVLPILERLKANQHKAKPKHCSTLIIVPTRELAKQIDDNIEKYATHIYHQRACVVGGVKYPKQIKRLNQGLDILVATPGRLEDHLKSGNLSLDYTETLILDEADQMLDLGFFPAIRRIAKQTPRTRQTILLSATMPKPIRALAAELLNNPKDVAVAPASTPVERIEQAVMLMEKPEKRPFLVQALENQFRTIIFTRTKHGADQLVKFLSKQNVVASAIHGNKSQNQRQRTLEAFRKGEEHILIATDIAARGIDIPDVSLVVNYDVPTTPEAYVHRIGRTARAGREGRAITLCAPEEQKHLRDVEKLIKIKLPVENVQAGSIDDDSYDPMKAAAKPVKKKPQEKEAHPSAERRAGKPSHKSRHKPRRGTGSSDNRGDNKGDNKGGKKRFGGDGAKGKKPFSKKPTSGQRGGSSSAEAKGGAPRKKGGNKNPPRGPARNRASNRASNRNNPSR
jgi:ATP-dependent RNA helicase RhlE